MTLLKVSFFVLCFHLLFAFIFLKYTNFKVRSLIYHQKKKPFLNSDFLKTWDYKNVRVSIGSMTLDQNTAISHA